MIRLIIIIVIVRLAVSFQNIFELTYFFTRHYYGRIRRIIIISSRSSTTVIVLTMIMNVMVIMIQCCRVSGRGIRHDVHHIFQHIQECL